MVLGFIWGEVYVWKCFNFYSWSSIRVDEEEMGVMVLVVFWKFVVIYWIGSGVFEWWLFVIE